MGGEWSESSDHCVIHYYLNSVCYRLSFNSTWSPDYSDQLHLKDNGRRRIGCRYSNHWGPYAYSTRKTNVISVSLRYFLDSYIIASSETRGCSDFSYENNNCIGSPASETHHGPLMLLVFALVSLVIELGVGSLFLLYSRFYSSV